MLLDIFAKLIQAVTETLEALAEEDQEIHGSLLNAYRRLDEILKQYQRPGF